MRKEEEKKREKEKKKESKETTVRGGDQERRPRSVVGANHGTHSPTSDRGPAEVSLWGMPWSATRGSGPMSPRPTRERRVKEPRKEKGENLRSCRARGPAAMPEP